MPFATYMYRVAALALALFCRMLGVFIILPVAAELAAALPDGGGMTAGLVLGGYGLTQALMQVPLGLLADRIGKKPVLLLALALFAAGGFIAAAADTVYGMIGGRLLQGGGAVAATAMAWIADITPPARRAPAMAIFGAMILLAFIVSLFAAPLLTAVGGLADIFHVAGWLGVVSLLLVLILPPPPVSERQQGMAAILRLLLGNADLLKIGGGAFVLHYALAALFYLLPPQLQLPTAAHWQVYSLGFALALPPTAYLIMHSDRQPRRCVSLAIVLMFAAFLLLPAAVAPGWATAVLFFFFAGFTALEAALPARATKTAPPEHRAAAMGIVMTCQFFGVFCGGAVSGVLATLGGGLAAMLAVYLLLAIWLVIVLREGLRV